MFVLPPALSQECEHWSRCRGATTQQLLHGVVREPVFVPLLPKTEELPCLPPWIIRIRATLPFDFLGQPQTHASQSPNRGLQANSAFLRRTISATARVPSFPWVLHCRRRYCLIPRMKSLFSSLLQTPTSMLLRAPADPVNSYLIGRCFLFFRNTYADQFARQLAPNRSR